MQVQVDQRSREPDPRARSSREYNYENGSFQLPPPARQDEYSEWAGGQDQPRWQEDAAWQVPRNRAEPEQAWQVWFCHVVALSTSISACQACVNLARAAVLEDSWLALL